jgi:hypothetical protein
MALVTLGARSDSVLMARKLPTFSDDPETNFDVIAFGGLSSVWEVKTADLCACFLEYDEHFPCVRVYPEG